MYFPCVRDSNSEHRLPPDSESDGCRGTETLLLVEDEPMVRNVAELALKRLGYRVLSASDGPSAVQLAESTIEPIHGIITDVVLPGMGGREVVDALHKRLGPLPTLYVSGYTGDRIDEEGIKSEGSYFLQKPFMAMDLGRSVRRMLGERK